MAHLLTNHDPYRLHACLGVLCLLHFMYRYVRLLCTGGAFGEFDNATYPHTKVFDVCAIGLHGALHATSFQFHLPRARNYHKPMIWTEFRYHSALFAWRHMVCTIVALLCMNTIIGYAVRLAVVLSTCKCAAWITKRFGDAQKRTTNTMPYPSTVKEPSITHTKQFYTTAQFAATACSVCAPPTVCFLPLCAIEIAPLLMTLVRKNRCTAMGYHRTYTIALLLNYPTWFLCALHSLALSSDTSNQSYSDPLWIPFYTGTYLLALVLRFHHRVPAMTTWWLATALSAWVWCISYTMVAQWVFVMVVVYGGVHVCALARQLAWML